jgi:hypothetical protein
MAYTQLVLHHTPGAQVEEISRESAHYRLSIPAGDSKSYRLAQLDDYTLLPRSKYPNQPPLSLALSARASGDSIPGTWGFGLWNHPFGLSLGFGGNPFSLPALPNAVWFFGASEENYLSFKEPRAERSDEGKSRSADEAQVSNENRASSAPPTNGGSAQREIAANGFIVQTFRSPRFDPLLIPAGLALPFSRKTTRRMLGQVIAEDGQQLWSPTARRRMQEQAPAFQNQSLSVDPTDWHRYRLKWREKRVSFEVDEVQVFESAVSPNPPLGLVIWIDNQYAAFTPVGKIGFGVLSNPEPAWLEVKDVEIKRP